MNREQQLESYIRELVQLSAGLLLQLSARGYAEPGIHRAGIVIDRAAAFVDPPPDNVIPFPVKQAGN
jgi:hypothetical protein